MYIEPNVVSSYRKNNIGETIYNTVIELKPLKVVEFGILHGYSTICIAQALRDIGQGHLVSYDLFDIYPYKHGVKSEIEDELIKRDLYSFVDLKQENLFEWLSRPEEFDLLHIDVSNEGNILLAVYHALKTRIENGATIIFEGGTKERDKVEWMVQYNKLPMFSIKDKINYEILDERFPGLSIIRGEK